MKKITLTNRKTVLLTSILFFMLSCFQIKAQVLTTYNSSAVTNVNFIPATPSLTSTNGSITAVSVTSPKGGAGYGTIPPIVTFLSPSGAGTGATATATLTLGVVTGVTVNNAGAGYINPICIITPVFPWVCPSDVSSVSVECWGAGGGGSGATSSSNLYTGGGGAGGNYSKANISVTPGATYYVYLGLGGEPGTSNTGSAYGGNGGASSFSTSANFSDVKMLKASGGAGGWGGPTLYKNGIGGGNGGIVGGGSSTISLNGLGTDGIGVDSGGANYMASPIVVIGNPWTAISPLALNSQVFSGAYLYTVTKAGTTGSAAPIHKTGSVTDGSAILTFAGYAAQAKSTLIGTYPNRTLSTIFITAMGSGYNSIPTVTLATVDAATTAWTANATFTANQQITTTGGNTYVVIGAGTSGTVEPSGIIASSGSASTAGTNGTATYVSKDVTVTTAATASLNPNYNPYNPVDVTGATTYYYGGTGGAGSYVSSSTANASGGGGSSAGSASNGINAGEPITAWASSSTAIYYLNQKIYSGSNVYTVTTAGTSGSAAPNHTSGAVAATSGTATYTFYGLYADYFKGAAAVTGGGSGADGNITSGTTAKAGTSATGVGGGGSGATSTGVASSVSIGGRGAMGQIIISKSTLNTPSNQLSDLKVYPNPVSNQLIISNSIEISSIAVTNLLGQSLKTFKITPATSLTVDVSDLAKGIYLVKIESAGKSKTVKVVKD